MKTATKRELGDAHEERVSKALGGRTQVGSGAVKVPSLRGDVVAEPLLVECKSTAKDSIVFSVAVWVDLKRKAQEARRLPAYSLSVLDDKGKPYDVICMSVNLVTNNLLRELARNGEHSQKTVSKTAKLDMIESLVLNRQYLTVLVGKETLVMFSVDRFGACFNDWKDGM